MKNSQKLLKFNPKSLIILLNEQIKNLTLIFNMKLFNVKMLLKLLKMSMRLAY